MPVVACPNPPPVPVLGIVAFDYIEFTQAYPEFTGANPVILAGCFARASLQLNNACSSRVLDANVRLLLLYMLTAHIAYITVGTNTVISSNPAYANASTGGVFSVNLPAGQTVPAVTPFDQSNPATYNFVATTQTYDSLGATYATNFYFIYNGPVAGSSSPLLQWTIYATFAGVLGNFVGSLVGNVPQIVTFNTTGQIQTPAGGQAQLIFNPTNNAQQMQLLINMGSTLMSGSLFSVISIAMGGQSGGPQTQVISSTGPQTAVGRLAAATEGSVSATLEYSAGNAAQYYLQSKYGVEYWQATANFRTMVYIPGASGPFNGGPLPQYWGGPGFGGPGGNGCC